MWGSGWRVCRKKRRAKSEFLCHRHMRRVEVSPYRIYKELRLVFRSLKTTSRDHAKTSTKDPRDNMQPLLPVGVGLVLGDHGQ